MTTDTIITPEELGALDDEALLHAYMQARDRKDRAKAAASRAEAVMLTLKAAINARLNERGSDGFKVDGLARVNRVARTDASCGDWTQFFSWLLTESRKAESAGGDPLDVFSFMQRRLTADAVKTYMATHDGVPPPAVNVQTVHDIRVTPI